MNPQLCSIPTIDGLLLDGAFHPPARAHGPADGGRAWIFVHGTGANFTSPGILQGLAAVFIDRGEAVLRLNTRGHDLMARIPSMQGSVLGGAAYERLDEARHDLFAAGQWLSDRGYSQLSMLGHSLGAAKVLIAQAHSPVPGVDELVALSPPRLAHQALAASEAFRTDYLAAAERVAAGRGKDLIAMREPLTLSMSAEGVLQKYGPEDRFDFLKHLPRVRQPTLVVLDGKSAATSNAFVGLAEALTELARSSTTLDLRLEANVDIGYRNAEVSLATQIVAWRDKRQGDLDISI